MKRFTLVFSIAALIALSAAGFAEGSAPFRADANIGANLCLGGLYPYGEAVFVWKPLAFVGIGAGLDTYIGLTAGDLWLAPLARLELGWFYLTGGPSFLLTPLDHDEWIYPTLENDTGVYFGLGLSHGFLPIGPGKLGFDARLSYAFAPIPYPEQDTDNLLAAIFQGMAAAIVDVMAGVRFGAGVVYSVPIGG